MKKMYILTVEVDTNGLKNKSGVWNGKVWGEKTVFFDGCIAVHLTREQAMIREDRSDSSGQVITLDKNEYDALAVQIASKEDGMIGSVAVSWLDPGRYALTLSKDGKTLRFDKEEVENYIAGVQDGTMLLSGLKKSQKEAEAILAKAA